MDAKVVGKIYHLISMEYTRMALRKADGDTRAKYAELCRKSAEKFKHDVCRVVDAECEKACRMLESDDPISGYCIYPETLNTYDKKITVSERGYGGAF